MSTAPRGRGVPVWMWAGALALVVIALGAVALARGGLLDLPGVPAGVTAESSGLANLAAMDARAQKLEATAEEMSKQVHVGPPSDDPLVRTAEGLTRVRGGAVAAGLQEMREGLALAPNDLVLGNAYRMTVLQLRRKAFAESGERTTLAEELGPTLEHEPIATLTALRREHPSHEATLQLALAWVDEMLVFPALEIKAPASAESVNLLNDLLKDDPAYVPALYGRGLNYLNRPARLVWPESKKMAPDCASQDLGRCVAIGRKIGGASPELVATLAMTLGDCYAKEGKPQRARSWWQIAANAGADSLTRAALQRRFTWQNEEMLDKLEQELENRMYDLDHPMTDLSMVWHQRRAS